MTPETTQDTRQETGTMTKLLTTIPGAGLLYVIAVQLTTAVQDMMRVTEGIA